MSRSLETSKKWKRETRKRRRDAWMLSNGPCRRCGGSDRLQLDHINPRAKVSHDIWLWGKERREAELTKCQVLCTPCHAKKTRPSQQAAGKKRRGMKQERNVFAEIVQVTCARCSKSFTRKAALERFAAKHRVEGPFCGAVCRGSACGKRAWQKRYASPQVRKLHAKIIKLGRQGLPMAQIQRLVGSKRVLIRRLLLADGQKIRKQGERRWTKRTRLFILHGTHTRYVKYHCRCSKCREAHRIMNAQYR